MRKFTAWILNNQDYPTTYNNFCNRFEGWIKSQNVQPDPNLDFSETGRAKKKFNEVYLSWQQSQGISTPIDFTWTGKETRNLKNLIKRLKEIAKGEFSNTTEFIENVLGEFLTQYANLKTWYSNSFTPSHILGKINEIITDVKKGATHTMSESQKRKQAAIRFLEENAEAKKNEFSTAV